MTINELLAELAKRGIKLRKNGQEIALAGERDALDANLVSELRRHKAALLEMIGRDDECWWSPPISITPAMLTLVRLTEEQIARIVARVPGGAANIQDIYPLAPLQEGILFHYLMDQEHDPYVVSRLLSFVSRERLDKYLDAMRAVIARNDVLRTAVIWDGLPEPVQVVLRRVVLPVEELRLDSDRGDAAKQLRERFRPGQYQIDVREAPLIRVILAFDAANSRWLMVQMQHHLIGDYSSSEMMLEEIGAFLSGHAEQLPTPLPFRTLVAHARLGMSQDEHEAYFRGRLGDVDEATVPFGMLNVPDDLAGGVEEAKLTVDVSLAKRIRTQARRLRVAASTLCHVAWARVIGQTSGREDVVFGTVLFGRLEGGTGSDRAMGLFINTLPMRIHLGKDGVETAVRQTHAQLAELMRHEHASLALAQRCSALPAGAPLFSAILNYRNGRENSQFRAGAGAGAWEGIRFESGEERTNYPLILSVDDRGEDLQLTAQVAAQIGASRVCESMHAALESIVDALEREPDKPLREVNALPSTELDLVCRGWNNTQIQFPIGKSVHQLVEQQVAETPDAVALIFRDASLSYAELNRQANRLARCLRTLGVRPDERVAVCIERGFEMVVALLAVSKAGGAYVPLDPAFPRNRLNFMIQDSSPVVLLTQGSLLDIFAGIEDGMTILDLKRTTPVLDGYSDTDLDSESIGLTPDHLAYVIYTSGSTGRPKGVQVSRRALTNLVCCMRNELPIRCTDVLLAVTTICFDTAGADVWLPLIAGAHIIVANRDAAMDGQSMVTLIKRHKVTFLQATPASWRVLLEAGLRNTDLTAICTGEAMPRELARRLRPAVGRLWNLYGPTETTIWSTAWRVDKGDEPIRIGRPIANTQCYILDQARQPVPIGVTGELYIAGDGLARGYLNRPELTQERFVANPFGWCERMYRSGDLARWLPDGTIECLGRNDFQVKIRGFRIELGEIEALLSRYPSIKDAVVVAREDSHGEKQLIAYYTSLLNGGSDQSATDPRQLRSYLSASLPDYMIPTAYVRMEALPLTPNGKLDRKALPLPAADAFSVRGYEPPQGVVENELAKIFSGVLNIDRVGRNDNFFDLGGHSLTAVRVVSLIKSELGVDLPLRILFQAQSVSQIAEAIAERFSSVSKGVADAWPTCIPIQAGGTKTPLFCVARPNVNAIGYLTLSRAMGPDQPVYGLQRQMLEDPIIDFTREQMAETAKDYIRAMQAVQPRGPYLLVGQCQGAYIAFEMTRQLEQQGEHVALLAMLDVWPEENTRHKSLFFAHCYVHTVLALLRPGSRNGRNADGVLLPNIDNAENKPTPSLFGNPLWRVYWPGPNFKPALISAKILVFRNSAQPFYRIRDKAMGWRDRTTGCVVVEELRGDHMTILREPCVRVLAGKLSVHLERAVNEIATNESSLAYQ